MVQQIESFYLDLYKKAEAIKVPISFNNPNGNIFVNATVVKNDITRGFTDLNKLLKSLKMKPIAFTDFIKELDEINPDKEELRTYIKENNENFWVTLASIRQKKNGKLARIIMKAHDLFEQKRGDIIGEIKGRLEGI